VINKIIGTVGARVYVGIVLLVILGLHSKNLGAEILGELAIFRFALTINHLFASTLSSPVVFVANRISLNRLILPSFAWIIICSIALSVIQFLFNLVDTNHLYHLILLSLLYSSQTFFEQVLLSKQGIKVFNFSAILYHTTLLATCLVLIFNFGWKTEDVFFYSMYCALAASNIFLIIVTRSFFTLSKFSFRFKIAGILFSYGIWVQLANFAQTLNYRIALILLDFYWGKKVVGYFSAGLQLAEAIWIIAKSLATVQYTKIANNKSRDYAIDLTLLLSKASFVVSFLAGAVLVLLPEKTLSFYLGKDFTNINNIILYLMPGILFFSISLIYSHYFSGRGKFMLNTVGSIISLAIIIAGGFLVIPTYGAQGAALVNSAGMLGMLIYNCAILLSIEKIPFHKLLFARNDLKKAVRLIKDYLRIT
jgi:O-antigen/teichoic acid export membrane protein